MLYAPLTSPMHATCPVHFILLALITLTILGEEYKPLKKWCEWNYGMLGLCNYWQSRKEWKVGINIQWQQEETRSYGLWKKESRTIIKTEVYARSIIITQLETSIHQCSVYTGTAQHYFQIPTIYFQPTQKEITFQNCIKWLWKVSSHHYIT
jgi:hypothetical protein